jgi:hypothetical protein
MVLHDDRGLKSLAEDRVVGANLYLQCRRFECCRHDRQSDPSSKQICFRQVDDFVTAATQNGFDHVKAESDCLPQLNSGWQGKLLSTGHDVD